MIDQASLKERLIFYLNGFFSILIFLAILILAFFSVKLVYNMFLDVLKDGSIGVLRDIAFLIVLFKVYKVLALYFKKRSITVLCVVQLSIIVPAIEVVFAPDAQPLPITIMLAIYSVANLVVYLFYHGRLKGADGADDA